MTNVKHSSLLCIFFLPLYMFRAHRARHQERQTMSAQPNNTKYILYFCNLDYPPIFRVTVTRGCADTVCLSS
jgi:hypothetical protein